MMTITADLTLLSDLHMTEIALSYHSVPNIVRHWVEDSPICEVVKRYKTFGGRFRLVPWVHYK